MDPLDVVMSHNNEISQLTRPCIDCRLLWRSSLRCALLLTSLLQLFQASSWQPRLLLLATSSPTGSARHFMFYCIYGLRTTQLLELQTWGSASRRLRALFISHGPKAFIEISRFMFIFRYFCFLISPTLNNEFWNACIMNWWRSFHIRI